MTVAAFHRNKRYHRPITRDHKPAMWVPLHRCPSFATSRKRQRVEEPADPNFLTEPKTDRLNCENVKHNGMEIGHASMQGLRVHMEDEHIIDTMDSLKDHTFVAIMDGHAGKFAAKFTSIELKNTLENTTHWKEYAALNEKQRAGKVDLLSKALVQAYIQMDKDLLLLEESGLMDESGCTCVCAVITPTHVICANVGDSRCVVGSTTSGTTTSLTDDHKPSNPEERVRIENAGGFVMGDRVNGELAMSRALGDFRYKRAVLLQDHEHPVICYPDVAVHKRSGKKDEILVLACDGVWDVMSNSEVVDYLAQIVLKEENSENTDAPVQNGAKNGAKNGSKVEAKKENSVTAQEAAESLIDLALAEGSTDNISAIVLKHL